MRNDKGQFIKGSHNNSGTEFKRGLIPWNKGIKGIHFSPQTEFKKGSKLSEITKKKISDSHKGERAYQWKGDKVGYDGLHDWVKKSMGKASKCKDCGSITKVQWANKSHEYKRDLGDWIQLCQSCHKKYDKDFLGAKERYERRVAIFQQM